MKIIAIDIGGTSTRVALFHDINKKEIKKFATNQIFEEQIKQIVDTINSFNENISAISISAPGPADYLTGVFGDLPNIPLWKGKNILQSIKNATGVANVVCQNDANLMALAHHYYFNNQKGITQFFTISTGLGAGLIIDNRIFQGAYGYAQEIANLPVAFNPEQGKGLGKGAVEYFASGSGIALRTKMQTQEALNQYNSNDQIKSIIDEAIDALANAIATHVAIINPSLIVFDGSVARNNHWYIEKAIQIARERSFAVQFEKLEFKFAELGDDAALIGAYHHIINKMH